MSVFDVTGFDGHDLSGDLRPLIAKVLTASLVEDRHAAFCEIRDRLIDHFEAFEPTLYAALRRFPHLTPRLMEADRGRDDMRHWLTDLSLTPPDSAAWLNLFVTLAEAVRVYLHQTEARLSQIAGSVLGTGELRRLGVEASRIRSLQATQDSNRILTAKSTGDE